MRILKNIATTAFAGAALLAASASTLSAADVNIPSAKYALEPTHTSLIWGVGHFGLSTYKARFTKYDVKIDLNVEDVTKSSVEVSIDPTSVVTNYPNDTVDFDKEIGTGEKFLNAGAFPTITFKSTSVEKTGEKTALIHGNMTMLGVTKPLTLNATLNGTLESHPYAKIPAVGFHAEGTLKRSEFGFDHLIPYVADDVHFVFEGEFLKAE